MQKSPSCGGRTEFMSSVPSLCQVAKALSIGVPSGGPTSLPWAVNVTCHMPTIGSLSSAILSSEPDSKKSDPCQDCWRRVGPNLLASPHDALANGEKIVTNKTTPSVPTKIRKVALLVITFPSPAGSAGRDES